MKTYSVPNQDRTRLGIVLLVCTVFAVFPVFSSTAYGQYCSATANYCDEYIGNVTVAGINNSTGCSGYANYSASVAPGSMDPGVPYTISVTNGGYPYSGDRVFVWVDWNDNQSFLDPGEYFSTNTTNNALFTGTISPPVGTQMGIKRMRVRMSYYVSPPGNPCGSESFGEVEDYSIFVTGCNPPEIVAPPSITLNNAPGQCGAPSSAVFLGQPDVLVDDCCEGAPIVTNDAPAYFDVGVPTVVTWTVEDGCGQFATSTQTVTVLDTEPPTLWVILYPQFLMVPDGSMRTIQAHVGAFDNCANIDWVLEGIYSNHPDFGTFPGDVPGDISAAFGAKTTSFGLRAENSPGGGSRLYWVRYRATDAGNRTVYATQTVSVGMGHGFGGPILLSDNNSVPTEMELQQNYPNPFSGVTSVTFRLPEDTEASVRVYNMLGSEVAVLAEGAFQAGSHSLEFNASELPEGVYLYKLISGSKVVTKKMVVVR